MSAGLAHEIRNPLGSIKGAAQLLEDSSELPSDAHEMLEIIQKEVAHLDHTMQGFLDYARPSNLKRAMVEPAEFLKAVVRLLGDDIELIVDDELPTIALDSDRILQVLRNLVRNAREAAPEEKIELLGNDRGDYFVMDVRDRGPGISLELKDQLFIPFVTNKSGGTGLGLAISQRIVKDHRGRLELRPREGGGTVARIMLPRLPLSVDESNPPATAENVREGGHA
jgi:signal transduction histidine kinase